MSKNIAKPTQDESIEENEKQGKAQWDVNAVDAFISICVAETIAGNRKCGHFSKEGWKNVIKFFNNFTKRTYQFKQLKNKWSSLKKEWQIWNSLVGKETGLGWDTVKQTIDASNEWWDKKLKENPEAAKFRAKGLRNVDQLDFLFKDVAVTGESAWAPSEGVDVHDVGNESVVGEQSDKNMEDDLEFDLEFSRGLQNINTSSPSVETIARDNVNKRKRDSKKTGVGVKVSNQLDVLLEAVANRSRSKDKLGCSIEEVMKVVKGMPEVVNDDDLFMKAADILTERKNREMFVALSEPDTQIMWLKNKRV